ncbi:MAG: helicase-associated domain-containing protein [Candidatus Fermentithermobacillus carboniphilus]|uniref:Helicase-associated domain-containing protein n=1 Tax=Candidatus Fermentithermobacillus carboniphilus TaxID=3085328 RepID=A0AAT9LBV3_9FIRM|nr:MAG: helicase-associated domain-containing protein [Candidatus Fermentithermobacillus carboniphilus]
MKLVEALLTTSGERVNAIAAFYGISTSSGTPEGKCGTREDIIQKISAHLLVPANTLVAMNGLNDEEILALRLITLAAGGGGVVVEQCHQRLNQISRKWRRNGFKVIEALLSRGLVFTRREGYRQVYFVPSDLREVLARFFLDDIFKKAALQPDRFSPRNRVDYAAPLRHLCLFLSYLRKNEVRVTQTGTMFKKAQADLASLIEEDSTVEDTFFSVRYPPRMAFLLYFAKSRSLCDERNGLLRLGSKVTALMESPYSSWRQELFDYWRQNFISQDTDLQTMLWIIMHSPEDSVLSLSALLSEMETLSTNHSSHGLTLRVEKNLVDILEYLGALQVSQVRNDILVKATKLGRALCGLCEWPEETYDRDIYVQSNFEILVPCTIEPRILWSIDAFAELLKPDQMMIYRLSRNSVYRALLHGYTPETIEAFLERHSKTPVPQNIIYSISHWGTSYGRIEFEDAILLKCDTEELADELFLSPKIRPHLKKKVGPCYLVVDRDSYDALLAALSEEGYMPKINAASKLSPETAGQP